MGKVFCREGLVMGMMVVNVVERICNDVEWEGVNGWIGGGGE